MVERPGSVAELVADNRERAAGTLRRDAKSPRALRISRSGRTARRPRPQPHERRRLAAPSNRPHASLAGALKVLIPWTVPRGPITFRLVKDGAVVPVRPHKRDGGHWAFSPSLQLSHRRNRGRSDRCSRNRSPARSQRGTNTMPSASDARRCRISEVRTDPSDIHSSRSLDGEAAALEEPDILPEASTPLSVGEVRESGARILTEVHELGRDRADARFGRRVLGMRIR